jgi:putative phosphoribosyl transferase
MKFGFSVRRNTETEETVIHLPFADRTEAGSLLARELAGREFAANSVVLALPRGGVPVGAAIADRLKVPLDVIVVRKLGVPWQPELAMGAIARSVRILDEPLVRALGITRSEIENVVAREEAEVESRERLYRGARPSPDMRGRNAILVDDGLATGSTMLAAVRCARALHAARVIVAVPVSSPEACKRLRAEADHCICLATPEPFSAVGEWYVDFEQVSDDEVRQLLSRFMANDVP